MFKCNLCALTYTRHSNLLRHNRITHNLFSYHCAYCSFGSNMKRALISHLKNQHNFPYSKSQGKKKCKRIKCPLCEEPEKNFTGLHRHLFNKHETKIEIESFTFANEHEFKDWKKNTEEQLNCRYVSYANIYRDHFSLKYFVCHRSYEYRGRGQTKERQRIFKSMGSNKMGTTCPSIIKYISSKKNISVNFVQTHIGHSNEKVRMRIHKDDRAKIAAKLNEGLTIQKVLNDIKANKTEEYCGRINFIKKKDLHNIIRDFKIDYMKKLHPDEIASVDNLVQKLSKCENSPILHYENHEEKFCLVIMTEFQKHIIKNFRDCKIYVDGTHSLNAYSVQLLWIVVVNECGNGIPCAFCFSKKSDLEALLLFFQKVKDAVGMIETKIFMSDDSPEFSEAWTRVMGEPQYHLLCWWHISKTWSKHINNKIKNQQKRDLVKKTLYNLATDIQDISKFTSALENFLNILRADEQTKDFLNYFSSFFVHKIKCWAFCYRQRIGLNTKINLENLYRKIKRIYLNENHPRVEKAVISLYELIRDTMLVSPVEFSIKNPKERIQHIRKSHLMIESSSFSDIEQEESISNAWFVPSTENRNVKYKVERLKEVCDQQSCILQCFECQICLHTYRCSCLDSTICLNICEHIHRVGIMMKWEKFISYEIDFVEMQVVNEVEIIADEYIPVEVHDIEQDNVRVRNKLEILLDRMKHLTLQEKEIEDLDMLIDKMNAIVQNCEKQ